MLLSETGPGTAAAPLLPPLLNPCSLRPAPSPLPPLQVPKELMAAANAPYTIVQSMDSATPLSVQPPSGNATAQLLGQLS